MKSFDCIKMKDEAQIRRAKVLQTMTPEQRLDYYQRAHEALEKQRDAARTARAKKSRRDD